MSALGDLNGAFGFGVIVAGCRIEQGLDAADARRLRAAYRRSRVLCLRTGRPVTPAAFLALARCLGAPQRQLIRAYRHPDHPEISLIASTQRDERGDQQRIVQGQQWHTDDSYMAVPCSTTLLHATRVPEAGGNTLFADLFSAYEALPGPLRAEVAGRRAVHKYLCRRNASRVPVRSDEEEGETPAVSHPMVRTHPVSGRKALFLNANRMDHVVGLSLEAGDALLDRLIAHASQPQFVYRHLWQAGDIVIWDNRATMHKVIDDFGDEPREMMRILLRGTVPV